MTRRSTWNGPGSVSNAPLLQSFLTTTSLIPDYPEFAAGTEFGLDRAIAFNRKPSFDPPTGDWYMSSGSANLGYKRLTTTVDLTGRDAAELAFKISYDTEPAYDFVFVEARSVDGTDWKTLPDANGHTGTSVGVGCTESSDYWLSAHPHLREYIVRARSRRPRAARRTTAGRSRRGAGTPRPASGGLAGLARRLNNADFTGDQVEVSIVYQTDPGTLGLGAFVDDATRHLGRRHAVRHVLRGRPRRVEGPGRAARQPRQRERLGTGAEHRPGRRPGRRPATRSCGASASRRSTEPASARRSCATPCGGSGRRRLATRHPLHVKGRLRAALRGGTAAASRTAAPSPRRPAPGPRGGVMRIMRLAAGVAGRPARRGAATSRPGGAPAAPGR